MAEKNSQQLILEAKMREAEEKFGIKLLPGDQNQQPTNQSQAEEAPQTDDDPNKPVVETDTETEKDEAGAKEEGREEEKAKPDDHGKHNWAKREADAKEAQRKLSKERERLEKLQSDLDIALGKQAEQARTIEEYLKKLEERLAPPPEQKKDEKLAEQQEDEDPELAELERDLPDVSKLAAAKAKKIAKELVGPHLEDIRKMKEEATRAQEAQVEAEKARQIYGAIFAVHPDAVDIANDPGFKEWLNETMPPHLIDSITQTVRHDPAEAIYVLDQWKKHNSGGETPTKVTPKGADVRPELKRTAPTVQHAGHRDEDAYTIEQINNREFMNAEMRRDINAYKMKLDRTLKNLK